MKLKVRNKTAKKRAARIKKKLRVRKKIFGTQERLRLCVYKSLKYVTAQVVNDDDGKTVFSLSSKTLELKNKKNAEAAKELGAAFGRALIEKKIKRVVFDRNGFVYHGRIKAFADAAREAGLEF
jgi:large subunit ribosomal protein L18